jgi:hypothetical protein
LLGAARVHPDGIAQIKRAVNLAIGMGGLQFVDHMVLVKANGQ